MVKVFVFIFTQNNGWSLMKMDVLKGTDIYYEGEIIDMSIFDGITRLMKNQKEEKAIPDNITVEKLSLEIKEINKKMDGILQDRSNLLNYYNSHPFKMSIIASLVASLIFSLCSLLLNNLIFLPTQINSKLVSIASQLDETPNNSNNDFESKIEDRISKLEVNVATIANLTGVYLYSDLEYTDKFISQLSENTYTEEVQVAYYSSAPPCQENEIIATNSKNGEKYSKKQLAGEKLLIPYTYNGQEVLFYGQYNENNNWDQDCTINVYENDKLVLVSETVYDNGVPSSFKQVFPSHTKEGANVWSIADRYYDNDSSCGETWNYFKFNERLKTFEFENAETDDIIYVSDFENDMKTYSVLEGYYYGKIEKGTYTDDSEKNLSYMMKNDKDGFVRTLYIGNFENGDFQDQTTHAQEIVFDESANKYFYYIGTFTKGKRDNQSKDALKYIDQKEIDKIIEPYHFNCELRWRETTEET